jgi:hypothetical protein
MTAAVTAAGQLQTPQGEAARAADVSPIGMLLQRRQELALTADQVRTLERLRNQLQRSLLKQLAEIQVAELELVDLQVDPSANANAVRAKLDTIERSRSKLRFEVIEATTQARTVLSQAQLQKVEPLAVGVPSDIGLSLDEAIGKQVQTALREQLRDRNVVEIETTQAITDRLTSLGRWLLLLAGIPLAILSFFGMRKLTDLAAVLRLTQKQLNEASDQVKATREQAALLVAQQQGIRQMAADLQVQYQQIRSDAEKAVTEISTVQQRVVEEGEKARLTIRTTAEGFKTVPTRIEASAEPLPQSGWPSDGSILTIPVAVHVLYNSDRMNISDAQVKSQIEALNLDFRAKNPDISNVPAPFKPLIGDARIEFMLASEDPLGQPTTGITRTRTKIKSFKIDGQFASPKRGGAKAWDTKRYLNIWVCELDGGILSASQFPGGPENWDGVVIDYKAFGTTGTAAAPFDKGRNATSAIAKYLDLRNIWSDDCRDGDLVADTPPQKAPNFGVPRFPHISCNNGPNGDLFMNFMDFVDDEVMVMFTRGQVERMHQTLLGPRRLLGRSSG